MRAEITVCPCAVSVRRMHAPFPSQSIVEVRRVRVNRMYPVLRWQMRTLPLPCALPCAVSRDPLVMILVDLDAVFEGAADVEMGISMRRQCIAHLLRKY